MFQNIRYSILVLRKGQSILGAPVLLNIVCDWASTQFKCISW